MSGLLNAGADRLKMLSRDRKPGTTAVRARELLGVEEEGGDERVAEEEGEFSLVDLWKDEGCVFARPAVWCCVSLLCCVLLVHLLLLLLLLRVVLVHPFMHADFAAAAAAAVADGDVVDNDDEDADADARVVCVRDADFDHVMVFMVGGGNYIERDDVRDTLNACGHPVTTLLRACCARALRCVTTPHTQHVISACSHLTTRHNQHAISACARTRV